MLLQPHGSIVANFVLHIFGLFWRNPWHPFTEPQLKNTALWDCCRREFLRGWNLLIHV